MDKETRAYFEDRFTRLHESVGGVKSDIGHLSTRVTPVCEEYENRAYRKKKRKELWQGLRDKGDTIRTWALLLIALGTIISGLTAWMSSQATQNHSLGSRTSGAETTPSRASTAAGTSSGSSDP